MIGWAKPDIEKDARRRLHPQQPFGQLWPSQLRHDHVAEQQLDRAGVLAGDLERLGAVRRHDHPIAGIRKDASGDLAQSLLVLDEQDRPLASGATSSVRRSTLRAG